MDFETGLQATHTLTHCNSGMVPESLHLLLHCPGRHRHMRWWARSRTPCASNCLTAVFYYEPPWTKMDPSCTFFIITRIIGVSVVSCTDLLTEF